VLDALADAEQVSVNDQELTERIVFQAQQYQMPPEEFVQRIQEAGQLGAIYADVRRSKALILAVREATVTDASGATVDMSDLIGDDTDDADASGDVQVVEAPEEDGTGTATEETSTDAPVAETDDAEQSGSDAEEKAATGN
jgi:trigger factor